MSFLEAEWRKLLIVNYEIDSKFLEKYIPPGTILDLWEGRCYVSLVGFMFLNTKIIGVKIPFHTNFEEVNLRFYVKRFDNGQWKRGVVFIRELVPKFAISFVANNVYNENYNTLKMDHIWEEKNNSRIVSYKWFKNSKWNSLEVESSLESFEIEEGSETEFITEHYWGYAKRNEKSSNEYEVTHPRWKEYKLINYNIEVSFKETYGEEFSFLDDYKVSSIMLAEGSEITLESKKIIRVD